MKLSLFVLLGFPFSAVRAADPQGKSLLETDTPGLRGGVNVATDFLSGQAELVVALEAGGEPLPHEENVEGEDDGDWNNELGHRELGGKKGCHRCPRSSDVGNKSCKATDRCRSGGFGLNKSNTYWFHERRFYKINNKHKYYSAYWMCGGSVERVAIKGHHPISVWHDKREDGMICWYW